MSQLQIAFFGEAEKGKFHFPYFCTEVVDLYEKLGNPPEESLGLYYALQALLYHQKVLFFRVREEGFSKEDYFYGFKKLEDPSKTGTIQALFLPGVGDEEILSQASIILLMHKGLLLMQEKDLYDYLTFSK